MYYKPGIIFYILTIITLIIFLLGMIDMLMMWLKGKREKKGFNFLRLFIGFLRNSFVQDRILNELGFIRWLAHVAIFYGFIGLFIHTTILFFLDWFIPQGSSSYSFMMNGWGKDLLDIWGDFFGLILFLGLLIAIFRNRDIKAEWQRGGGGGWGWSQGGSGERSERSEQPSWEDPFALILLLLIVITGFLLEGARLSLLEPSHELWYSFIGSLIAYPVRGLTGEGFKLIILYIHIALSFFFIAYIPFSRMIHIFTAPIVSTFNTRK